MPGHGPPHPARQWLALAGVALGVFMFTLDGSIVNIAVPTLVRKFQTNLSTVQWVIQGYLALIVLLLLPVSNFAGRLGQKRIFLAGIALFSTGSLLCGLAPTIEWLIAFRLVQGSGAVCMAALMTSTVTTTFPKNQIGRALGVVTASATLGSSFGPTIGGFLIVGTGWQSIFFVNVPVGILAFTLVATALPHAAPRPVLGPRTAWAQRFALFRDANFSVGIAGRFLTMAANAAFLFLTPLVLEEALHFPTNQAGLLLAAAPMLIGLTSPLFGILSDRHGAKPYLIAGLVCMTGGLLMMGTYSASMTTGAFLLKVALWGLGMGLFNAPNTATIITAAPPERSDAVSALISLAIMLGQFTGVTAAGALFHRIAFGSSSSGHVLSLLPTDLAAAVGTSLALFAAPILVLLAANLRLTRQATR